ncbi:unnamed protein product [Adineta steineri]|uniref:DDE-1 domain-containing protein n=1 Tax=Adineta steineri TaxID=433720 RepID=A0A814TLA8_9BILA|nr:unnamed protein product [Adineta steineri]
MPDRTFVGKQDDCKGGKRAKDRYTVLLCTNWTGSHKLKPLVIGKSARPRCFKSLNLKTLPITWCSNKTSWMNAFLFTRWLNEFDEMIQKHNRKIILFLDNAPVHSSDVKLTNINLKFFPANTTSKIQPLDQGVIRCFKAHYRKQLVQHLIANADSANSADDISITALDAIWWIDAAWKAVSETTIQNIFKAAGFTTPSSLLSTPSTATSNSKDAASEDTSLIELNKILKHSIDDDIPAFNIWSDGAEKMLVADGFSNEDVDPDENKVVEEPPSLSEAVKMLRRLRLLTTTKEDIDGATLALLQHNDLIQIFPRVKDRVKFVDQRAKLILHYNDQQASKDAATLGVSDSTLSVVQVYDELENNDMLNSVDSNDNIVTNNRASTTDPGSSSSLPANDDDGDIDNKPMLPDDYEGPNLTSRMEEYIEQENITKFNPHTRLRSELLSLIYDNVTKSYDLLYPSHDDYLRMAKLIVNKLRIPPTLAKNSIKDWHESLKQKFKRERKPLQMNNDLVKSKQDKYGNGKTNGRPKTKSTVLQAERRRVDIPLINLTDQQNEHLSAMVNQMNTELLKDDPNNDLLRDLWIQSFNIRRLCIRELDIVEILERFPGYRRSEMILAEVKESTSIDIEENVNVLLPKFFDHIPDNNCFLADVLPIRVIRILCKLFGDTVANIFTYEEVLIPGPCMKILDDKFELYLDFHLITHTSSCSQALALLMSLYYVFEIKFGHHNRCSRLLYGILFEDTHYLNKALKNLLNSWKYKIVNRSFVRRQVVVTNLVESLTQSSTTNEHILSPSDISNESAHVPTEQSHSDRYTSSQLNVTISRNIDEENFSEVDEDDFTQPSATVEDDFTQPSATVEDHIYQSSTTTRQALAPLTNSSIIIQNKPAPISHAEDSFLNLNSKELHQIHASQTFSSTQELENEIDPAANPDKSSSAVSRKRKAKTPRSSSSISTPKTSARLEAKRARLH